MWADENDRSTTSLTNIVSLAVATQAMQRIGEYVGPGRTIFFLF